MKIESDGLIIDDKHFISIYSPPEELSCYRKTITEYPPHLLSQWIYSFLLAAESIRAHQSGFIFLSYGIEIFIPYKSIEVFLQKLLVADSGQYGLFIHWVETTRKLCQEVYSTPLSFNPRETIQQSVYHEINSAYSEKKLHMLCNSDEIIGNKSIIYFIFVRLFTHVMNESEDQEAWHKIIAEAYMESE